MKKLLLFFVILILSQCKISVETKEANAQSPNSTRIISTGSPQGTVDVFTRNSNGMIYKIFIYDGFESGGIFVVNETKEKLEIEKLKLEIDKLKGN
jgi:hypothetical protein